MLTVIRVWLGALYIDCKHAALASLGGWLASLLARVLTVIRVWLGGPIYRL